MRFLPSIEITFNLENGWILDQPVLVSPMFVVEGHDVSADVLRNAEGPVGSKEAALKSGQCYQLKRVSKCNLKYHIHIYIPHTIHV